VGDGVVGGVEVSESRYVSFSWLLDTDSQTFLSATLPRLQWCNAS
jgi:hypothetical protein